MSEQRPSLPRLDTNVLHDEPASERLIIAVAQTLDIPRRDILLFDSFIDLGGDEDAAEALRMACRRKGIEAKADDIMGCHTLAELQTRITPFPPRLPLTQVHLDASTPATSEEEEGSVPSSLSAGADEVFSPTHRYSVSSYGSLTTSSSSNDSCAAVRPTGQDLESLLKSSPRVRNVCLVTPRAGPFDGQLVALVSISDAETTPAEKSGDISLPPRSEHAMQKKEIRSLRMAVQEWGADSRRPQIWIPLLLMAEHDDGRPDTRALQTWVQNINEAVYEEIMKLQIPEPRRRGMSPMSRQRKIKSWAESRRSVWREEDQFDCDEMECFPLAPMQQLYFQTSMRHVQESASIIEPGYRHTQSIMLRIKGGADDADIEAAVEAVVARHAMLRARFRPIPDDWVQVIIPQASNSYRFGHHTDVDDEEMVTLIEAAQATINPTDGPVFAVEHVKNDNEQTLYLTAHHLVVDLISWRIIVHDLDELLHEGTLLSEGSIPFPYWVDYQSYEMSQRLFEPTLPFEVIPADLEYWNLSRDSNCYGNTQQSSFSLSAELSSILQKACVDVLRTDAADLFLASLLLSFRQTFADRAAPTLWKREHGREVVHDDFNIMETVGWFTSLCPVGVGIDATTDLIQVIKLMKDTRRAIPRDGIPFFTSEFSTAEGATGIPVEVILNWVDTLQQIQRPDGILQPVPVPGQVAGTLRSDIGPKVGRMALFEVSVMIDDSGARVEFTYNKNANHQGKIQMWVQAFEHLVLEAIGRMRYHEPELTLSDVPLLRTSYKALARLGADRLVGSGLPSSKDVETIYPVTPAQQEILMSQSQSAESFHVHGVYELRAPDGNAVDATRLCKAWESIVASKPALRSIFIDSVSREGLFDQVVLRKVSPSMLFIESTRPEEALAQVPTLKTSLTEPRHRLSVCHTSEKTLVRVDVSQAICDLMSVHNLVAELCSVYSGQTPSHNESLHRTYLYHVSSLDTSYSLEVWKADLAGAKSCLFPQLSPEAEAKPQPFDLEVTREQLMTCCQEREVEPAAVLQLAWALVLRAFVGMDRVAFGYQYAGRDEELLQGIGKAVGSFASILPCSIDASPNQSIKKCLATVNEAFANSRKHQSLTMAEIQHALRLREKDLFNTCFFFEDSDVFVDEDTDLSELIPSLVTSARRTDCHLSLTAMFTGNHLHANLSSRFLSNNQVQSVMHSFECAVKSIIEHPTRLVAEVDLFTDRDYAQLVVQDWEASQRSQKVSACLHDVILRHGQIRPHAPAICSWDGDLTYIQLATLVTRLRTYLVNLGVGPGMTVPVILEKNRWAPVMLLAVMQAGASFVALDYQDQLTVRSTINYLNPHIVLATETAWKELGTVVLNLVIINNAFFVMLPPRMSTLVRESTPEQAACVFVTPKRTSSGASRSIFFTHASLCSIFSSQGVALKMDSESRVLQLSAFNVDICLVEILGTMVHGGCVCIPSASDRVHDLSGVMARMGVTWTYMTGVLARRIKPETVPALKTLCFRTRKLDPDTYGPWLENRNVLLAYGAPDVCPLGISVTEVANGKDLSVIPPPLAGRFWILNPEDPRKLMPVGAIGELAIDSPTVTPHRFAPDLPLVAPSPRHSSDKQKARYLKTGHRVRYLDDGNVQFISSVRDDVVVDGSSVDVADVEQRIRRCLGPGVDVVVDKIATKDSIRVLAAFLELGDTLFHGQEGFDKVSIRVKERTYIAKKLFDASLENPEARAAKLPEHCVPAVFIPLKDFPMSTSLKINRRKLLRIAAGLNYSEILEMSTVPNPQEIQRVILTQKPLPLTRPEEVMRAIWARVLSLSPADVRGTSSFLSAGGNKFLASELIVSCRRVGLRVSLAEIFTEATLTEVCRSASLDPSRKERVKASHMATSMKGFDYNFVKSVIAPELQCPVQDVLDVADASSEQVRNLELGMYTTRADIVCLVLNFNGSVCAQRLQSACEALTKLHPVLRTAFIIHEYQVCQVMCSSFTPTFNKFACPNSQLDIATEKLVKQGQDIEFQPNLPVTAFSYLDAGEQSTLVVRLSKAQIDDASAPLFVQDLTALYEAKDVPTASSFFEYMRAAKANYLEGIAYWTEQLDGAKMTNVVSHSKPCGMASQAKSVQETVKISMLSDYGMAPDTIIKAAWATVLATISGMNDVLFGETIQGHNIRLPDNANLSSMVGPLTNTIPVRVHFPSGHRTPLYLMKNIQRQRRSNCRYESFGIQELAQKCTDWPSWTRFSTVVQHRAMATTDGSATLNIGNTTFTYKTVEPGARDLPDLLVCSTMETSERMGLEIKFAEDRVSSAFAEDCMRLLVAALETLTYRDTVDQPMLQSAEEIERSEKRIPFPAQEQDGLRIPLDQLLLPEQRGRLETAVSAAWDEALKPKGQDKLKQGAFYTDGNSLLPAHPLAKHLNQKLLNANIKGINAVTFTAEDVIENPTMLAQLEFIARRLREGGALSLPLSQKTMSFRVDASAPAATPAQRPKSGVSTQPLTWRNSIRLLRGRESRGSMRGLSIKAPSWKRHKENKDHKEQDEGSPTSDEALVSPISSPRTPMSSIRESAIPELMDISSLSGLFAGRNSGGSDNIVETIIEEGDEKPPVQQGGVSPLSPTCSEMQKSMWGALYNGRESPVGGRVSTK